MISDNEATKAYETLKKYCKERSHCKDCAFLKKGESWAWIDLPKMDNLNYEKVRECLNTGVLRRKRVYVKRSSTILGR